jgi:hypothetical protein
MTKQQVAILTTLLLAGYVVFCGIGYLIGRGTVPAPVPVAMTAHRPTSTPRPATTPYGRVTSFARPIAPFVATGSDYPAEAADYLTGVDDTMREVYTICQEADALLADEQLSIAEFHDGRTDLYLQLNAVIAESVDPLTPPPELHGMYQDFREALQWLGSSIVNHPAPDEAYLFDEPYVSLGGDEPLDCAGWHAGAVQLLESAWEARQAYLEESR